jgi:predicted nucleic acid-binding protein
MERTEKVLVVDASIVTKWFAEEEYSTKALKIRDDYVAHLIDITAPELLPFEVLNAFRYNPEFGEKDLKEVAEALVKYSIWLFPILGRLAERTRERS